MIVRESDGRGSGTAMPSTEIASRGTDLPSWCRLGGDTANAVRGGTVYKTPMLSFV